MLQNTEAVKGRRELTRLHSALWFLEPSSGTSQLRPKYLLILR